MEYMGNDKLEVLLNLTKLVLEISIPFQRCSLLLAPDYSTTCLTNSQ